MLRTEYEFTLPLGFVDRQGNLHRDGVMRLSTALDEVEAMRDARVRANDTYLSILLLSRVVHRLGDISPVEPEDIEALFSADFVYLQDMFVRVNDVAANVVETECPTCGTRFPLDLSGAFNEAERAP
jgi:hypothetical protein